MNNKLKHPGITGFVLILSAYACSADSMTLQPIIDLLSTEVFPEMGYAMVSLIMTISAIAMAVISIATGAIVKIGKKRVLIAGTLLFTIGGLAGMLINNLYFILVTRLIEGAGAGIVLTVSMMLIPSLFVDQGKVDWLMGLNGVMTSIFAMIIGFASGYIALVNWKLPFLFYAFGVVMLILQIIYIPNDKAEQNDAESMPAAGGHITRAGIAHAIEAFIYSLIGTFFFVGISGVVAELGIGNSAQAGTITTFDTLGSMLLGFGFAAILKKCKGYSPAIFYALMVIGPCILLSSNSLVVACIGAFVFGMGYNQMFSFCLTKVSIISSPEDNDANMALTNGLYYLGMFAASFVAQFVFTAANTESNVFLFKVMIAAYVVLTVYALVMAIMRKGEIHTA